MADVSSGDCLFSGTETVPKGQAAAIVCIVTYDAYAQLPVNALRRELRGEPYAGKPHVRFGEGGVGYPIWVLTPTSMDFGPALCVGHSSTP